jgi:hypothetical protein
MQVLRVTAQPSVFKPLEIEANNGMIRDDSGKLPAFFAEPVQLALARPFLFREIAIEQLVLPHGFIFHVHYRCDRRGGAAGEIEPVAHDASFHNQHSAVRGRQPLNKLNNISKLNIYCALLVQRQVNEAELREQRCALARRNAA